MGKGLPKSIGPESAGAMLLPKVYTVATAPPASAYPVGTTIFVSNGVAGSPGLAFSDGTNWKRADTPATTIAAA